MGIATQKYIRKPLYVDAVRVTQKNFDEIASWCQGEVLQDEIPGQGTTKKYVKVRVHNPKSPRQTKAFVGDWILYTERGYKVYTNKAFRAAFDVVTEETSGSTSLEVYLDEAIEKWRAVRDSSDGDVKDKAVYYIDAFQSVRSSMLGETLPQPETPTALVGVASAIEEVAKGTTPQGEPHEVVEATSEAIADVVNEQQPVKDGRVDPDAVVESLGAIGQPEEPAIEPPKAEEPQAITEDEAREQMDLPPRPDDEDTPIAPPPTPAITPPNPEEPRLQTETGDDGKIRHEPVFSQGGGGPVDLADDVQQEVESRKSIAQAAPEDRISVKDQRANAEGKRVLSVEEQHQMSQDEVRDLLRTGEVVLAQDLAEAAQA